LRQAREALGLSLDELTRTTKIRKATLIALEATDLEKLPARIYTRGFIKAYAQEVGLDPAATADAYLGSLGAFPPQFREVASPPPPPTVGAAISGIGTQRFAVIPARSFSRMTTLAAVAGLVFYIVSVNRRATEQQVPVPSAVDTAALNASAAGLTPPAAHSESVSMTISGALTVELVPQGPCWLVATVDGARVVFGLLQPGDRQTLAITHEAVLRVGDPGALSISINGQTGRVLGKPGQPVNVKITKNNFKEFLSS
jgi:cytoskeleton protein RodZ